MNDILRKVFLGGTVNGSKWREAFIPLLKIAYFDPVVPVWTEQAYENELRERESCDFLLYVITPKASGFYSIAEVVDDSNKRPEKTIFLVLETDDGAVFSPHQLHSLKKVGKVVEENGGKWVASLGEAAELMNGE